MAIPIGNNLFQNILLNTAKNVSNPVELESKMATLLTVDKKAREIFKEFAKLNPELCNNSPLLYKIVRVTKDLDRKDGIGPPKSYFEILGLSTLYYKFADWLGRNETVFEQTLLKNQGDIKEYIQSHNQDEGLTTQELIILVEYINSGFIKIDQLNPPLIELLQKVKGGFNPLESRTLCIKLSKLIVKLAPTHPGLVFPLLSLSDHLNMTLLEHSFSLEILLPILEDLKNNDIDSLYALLSTLNSKGKIPFHSPAVFKIFSQFFIDMLSSKPDLAIQLLSITDDEGETFLFNLNKTYFFSLPLAEASIPLLEKLHEVSPNELLNLLSIKNNSGITCMNKDQIFPFFRPLLTSLIKSSPDLIPEILAIKDGLGKTAMTCTRENFKKTVKWLLTECRSDTKLIVDIITKQPDFFEWAGEDMTSFFSLINIVKGSTHFNDYCQKLLLIEDEDKNTQLHKFENFEEILKLAKEFNIDLTTLKNRHGLTPLDRNTITLEWLSTNKSQNGLPIEISKEEYNVRAANLKSEVLKYWDTFRFGYKAGKINPIYLDVKLTCKAKPGKEKVVISRREVASLNKEVKNALEVMLDRIEKQTPFLGTPTEADIDGRHKFYSDMLQDFETVLQANIKRNDPDHFAGSLIAIAKTQLEERCGAAYRVEINQQKNLATVDDSIFTPKQMIRIRATLSLITIIENLGRTLYKGDSHGVSSLLKAAGLFGADDHLYKINMDLIRKLILKNLNMTQFLNTFIDNFPQEYSEIVLIKSTPKTYDAGYLPIITIAKEKEKLLRIATVRSLKLVLEREKIKPAISIIKSTKGPDLTHILKSPLFDKPESFTKAALETSLDLLNHTLKKRGVKPFILNNFPANPTESDFQQLEESINRHIASGLTLSATRPTLPENPTDEDQKTYRAALTAYNKVAMDYATARRIINNSKILFMETVVSADKLQHALMKSKFNTKDEFSTVITARQEYIDKLSEIADEAASSLPDDTTVDASYDPKSGERPSQTFNRKRGLIYNEKWLDSPGHSAYRAMQLLGIIENPSEENAQITPKE